MNTYLQYDFKGMEKVFTQPIEIIKANKIENVPEAFKKVERALSKGYYVAGYVSYEAAPAFDTSYYVSDNSVLPLIWFGVFEEDQPGNKKLDNNSSYTLSEWKNTISRDRYDQMIEKIKSLIGQGITYQVNYTTRLKAHFSGDSHSFYQQLLRNQSASYCAYLNIEDYQILSISPELFFHVDNGKIKTKPMKGTIKRGKTLEEDSELKKQLQSSKKDQAENVMIVDLLRNDLGRIAKPGSITVKSLFEIEQYPTVHQMTSTIEAVLEEDKTVWDWFEALFPCGSITGAPKVETMKQIAEIETTPREVYCGAIGWIGPDRQAVFSVPIRTVWINNETGVAAYGTGSGVTWHSNKEDEYAEWKQKAAFLSDNRPTFSLLESILLENGTYPLLDYHLKRLHDSAIYFSYKWNKKELIHHLSELANKYPHGKYKVRLLLDQHGSISVTADHINELSEPIHSLIALKPISSDNVFLYHKTTNRSIYKNYDQYLPEGYMTTLLWNENGFLTEFTIGNVVFEKNGMYYTPPVSDGLLNGTMRAKLIDKKIIKEKQIPVQNIDEYDQIWFINSVRGWLKVELLETNNSSTFR
ncbi:para-aminobenzoate synthetase / 4-amino-4-deoxychorismate lyase [Gracilibacillus ureilyticus]|uniref:Para-aminobenzoate synthetase / 4-amino-4-deoxychorismate lyase n=1 Tax=Gracilibacillus ureilyticus TaxID=531814 RepID=A0A1H9S2U3_9BACI|nr:aminodeoxychorismate synthase component I [Gracilibacillus ureilyticus]SER79386.1 para-aminobenzoate synthetase / 4-amino-4-deoxychorismate lyase [Gracilibacillus ureilyticus]